MRRLIFFILVWAEITFPIIPGPTQKPKLTGELRWVPEYTGNPQIFLSWAGLKKDTAQVGVFRDGQLLTYLAPGTKNYSDADINPDVVYNYLIVAGAETLKTATPSFSECQIKNICIAEKGINFVRLIFDPVPEAAGYEATVLPVVNQDTGSISSTFIFSSVADNPEIRISLPLCWWNTEIVSRGFAIRALVKSNSVWTRWTTWREVPADFGMMNYPNPFNPTTTIKYSLPQAETVTLTIYNMLGQKVRDLVNLKQQAGNYSIVWDATDQNRITVPTGVYFYRIEAGSFAKTNKMTLMK